VPAARLLADRQHRPDAMLAHVAETHGPYLAPLCVIGPARVAGRACHKRLQNVTRPSWNNSAQFVVGEPFCNPRGVAPMSNETSENVRQHVRKMLAQLRALKEQQREKPGPDVAVEIDREEDPPSSVNGGESPT
jgi:hypothetical protein